MDIKPMALIIVSATEGPTRQKDVRQKNGVFIFLSHIFLSGGRKDDQRS